MEQKKTLRFSKPFETEGGFQLKQPEIAYHSWGTLNDRRDNVVVICHALTGHSNAREWFGGLIGQDKALDPSKHFILCPNILGSCYGSTGPQSLNPETDEPYQGNFPEITVRDIVRFNQYLLDHLEVSGIELVVGGSLGGMTALEFSLMDDRVRAAACFVMGKAHSPWAIGISHAQRMAIYADEHWNDGFYDSDHPPHKGLAAARAMAMITYRTPENYQQKFGREIHPQKEIFQVESYLEYQGQKLTGRFDANSYITLSRAMDTHDISRSRASFKKVLGELDLPVLVVGFDSDQLYPISDQKELADLIPQSTFAALNSPYGHDAFLIEFEQLDRELQKFINQIN